MQPGAALTRPGPGTISELAGHLAATTARFFQLVGEFDARRGWACWDLPSCAAWLAWKCQVAPGAGHISLLPVSVIATRIGWNHYNRPGLTDRNGRRRPTSQQGDGPAS
jgi:hypothetical protein